MGIRLNYDPDFEADLSRYPNRAFLREQSIWAYSGSIDLDGER